MYLNIVLFFLADLLTLAGNDSINGSGIGNDEYSFGDYAFKNAGVLNTGDGNDTISGSLTYERFGNNNGYNIINLDTLNTGEGNDIIDGSQGSRGYAVYSGIYNPGTLNTGEGDDTITAFGPDSGFINEAGTVNTGGGNDIITASGGYNNSYGVGISIWDGGTINTGNGEDSIMISAGGFINFGEVFLGEGNDSIIANGSRAHEDFFENLSLENYNTIETGDGNDTITSASLIYNEGFIETGNGDDLIESDGGIDNNGGTINMGDGNKSIIITYENFTNRGSVFLGEGNDIITSTGIIYNESFIDTGNGDDSIIVDGFDDMTGNTYGIYNNGGAINMGDGNDSIIANEGFESAPNSSGAWFLGEGDDYIKGYGSGDFYGGSGNDTLELTPGTYTVGIGSVSLSR